MVYRWRIVLLLAGLILLTASCSGQSAPTALPRSPSTPTPSPVVTPPEAEAAVAAAKKHLADRLQRPAQEITVRQVEAVEWPDSSLGCPKPGMMYAQVITPGYRLLLVADGASYEYHTDRAGRAVPCP